MVSLSLALLLLWWSKMVMGLMMMMMMMLLSTHLAVVPLAVAPPPQVLTSLVRRVRLEGNLLMFRGAMHSPAGHRHHPPK
jgi:hypothetical protein